MLYKVVPAAMVVSGSTVTLADYYQKIINEHAQKGWVYNSMETATSEQSEGCSLVGMAPQRTMCNLLVFYKPEPGDSVAAPAAVPASVATSSAAPAGSAVVTTASTAPYVPTTNRPQPAAVDNEERWICSVCGTANKISYGMCKKCATYRGKM